MCVLCAPQTDHVLSVLKTIAAQVNSAVESNKLRVEQLQPPDLTADPRQLIGTMTSAT